MSDELLTNNYEVLIIHHLQEDCIEIIGYDGVRKIEAPRIYISGGLLFSKMSKQSFDRNLFRCREEGAPFDFFNGGIDEFLCDVLYGYAINFIHSRLVIHDSNDNTCFTLDFEAKTGDKVIPCDCDGVICTELGSLSRLDVIIPKPAELKPFDRKQYRKDQQALRGRSGSMHGRLLQAVLTAFHPPQSLASTSNSLSASLEPTRRWQKSAHEVIQRKHIVRYRARVRTFCDEEDSPSTRSLSGPSTLSSKRVSLVTTSTTSVTSAASTDNTPTSVSKNNMSVFSRRNLLLSEKKSAKVAIDNSSVPARSQQRGWKWW
jgi:hypothetical protein